MMPDELTYLAWILALLMGVAIRRVQEHYERHRHRR